MRRALDNAAATVRAHPRHLVLAALVSGLLLGRASAPLVLLAALACAACAGRRSIALLAAAAVLTGSTFADARLAALDAGVLASMTGSSVDTRVVVLEPVRDRTAGPSVAR